MSDFAPNVPVVEATLAADDHRQKELGAFYTPSAIAEKLADWAIRTPGDHVLDPSFGNLVFLRAAGERLASLGLSSSEIGDHLFGIDIDPGALATASRSRVPQIPRGNLILQDFFKVEPSEERRVDVLLGNPPYIRYQGFSSSRELSQLRAASQGVRLNGLASSWAAFVVHGATFLREGGRMAQVLPAEILHAQYAAGVLDYLEGSFRNVTIAVFEERVFPGALEEVVLLFADGFGHPGRQPVRISASRNTRDMDVKTDTAGPVRAAGRMSLLSQLISERARGLLDDCRAQMQTLGSIASVDIGVVTGANKFFVLTAQDAEGIDPQLIRASVSRAAHMQGARLTSGDHDGLVASGKPAFMLMASGNESSAALASIQRRVEWGEISGFDQRYKCRIRDPWWALPSRQSPDLFLTYCSNDHPRVAVNEVGAIQTNTLHGVRVSGGFDVRQVAAGFYNSVTLLCCELEGRSYGGGVLKLEPTEAERLLMPVLVDRLADVLVEVDQLVRARQIDDACEIVDDIVLIDGLGLGAEDIRELRTARFLLASRRQSRSAAPRS